MVESSTVTIMSYKVTRLFQDGTMNTAVIDDVPDYASLNHQLDKCEIKSFIVSLN